MLSASCKTCGSTFSAPLDHGKPRKFCSRQCFENFSGRPPKTRECNNCAKPFKARYRVRDESYQRYCSTEFGNIAKQTKQLRPCSNCGKETFKSKQKLDGNIFFFCDNKCSSAFYSGSRNPNWQGGRYVEEGGRVFIATNDGYIAEHRLVVAKALGRDLRHFDEPIIHLNGNLGDNRLENLYIFPSFEEMARAIQNGHIPSYSNITPLEYAGHELA